MFRALFFVKTKNWELSRCTSIGMGHIMVYTYKVILWQSRKIIKKEIHDKFLSEKRQVTVQKIKDAPISFFLIINKFTDLLYFFSFLLTQFPLSSIFNLEP